MNDNVIRIDLAKNILQVYLSNEHYLPVITKKVTRANLLKAVMILDAERIVIEACCSSNYFPPHEVKPFVLEGPEQPLSATARSFIADLYGELIGHDRQIERQEMGLKALLKSDDDCEWVRQIQVLGLSLVAH
jgi:hypothetical protein